MNSKWHLYISYLKSCFRIFGCVFTIMFNNFLMLAVFFGLAEILGILEEIKDDR